MISFLKFLRGYLCVIFQGPDIERFFNMCVRKKILFWSVKRTKSGIYCKISRNSLPIIKECLKKTGTKMEIEKKCGLPFLLYRHRKRRVFAIGCFLALILIYIMSLFIWDIRIIGNESYDTKEIMSFVTKNYAHGGQLISTVDTIALEEALRTKFDKFAWVSCEIKGTQLTVHIKETINLNVKKQAEVPCDLVASKNGTIFSIITRAGTGKVVAGNTVSKGDVLISGTVSYVNDSKEIYEEAYVPADGDVIAKTKYPYEDKVPLIYYEKRYTDDCRHGFSMTFFSKNLPLWNPKISNNKEFDYWEHISHFKLGKTFYFPVSITRKDYKYYILERKTRNRSQAKALAQKDLEKFCNNLCKKGVEIVENNVTINVSGENLLAKGEIIVLEPIGKISLIDTDKKENVDEHSGKTD